MLDPTADRELCRRPPPRHRRSVTPRPSCVDSLQANPRVHFGAPWVSTVGQRVSAAPSAEASTCNGFRARPWGDRGSGVTKAYKVAAPSAPASIADPFWDLLAQLDYGKRQGLTRRLAIGFYEGWHPSRAEVALLVDFELGRITEKEYLAAGPSPETVISVVSSVRTTVALAADRAAADSARRGLLPGLPAGDARAPARLTRIATFSVDCGHLPPPFRMVVRGLTVNGWSIRGGQRYRMVTLHYVLLPPIGTAGRRGQPVTPVLYTAAITCLPDVTAPGTDADGRHSQHSVRPGHVAGSRGPWPVADGARTLDFQFSEQHPVGAGPARQPAGVLRVDLPQGQATWRAARPNTTTAESRSAHQ